MSKVNTLAVSQSLPQRLGDARRWLDCLDGWHGALDGHEA